MDVSAPITTVIPGVGGLVVAALLTTNRPRTGAEIARSCPSASEMGVRKALRRLAVSGLVREVPGGFVLNRDHITFPAVELLDGLFGRLRRRIRGSIEEWGGEVVFVGIFGSAARRDGSEESDIDLLLVSNDPSADDFGLVLGEDVKRWTGNSCQVFVARPSEVKEMERRGESLVAEWTRDLDPIVGSIAEVITGSRRMP